MSDKFKLISSGFNSIGNLTDFTSSEIIPYVGKNGNQQFIAVPYDDSSFLRCINIKEDQENLWLSPYDLYEEDNSVSLLDIISSDIKKGDSIYENFKYSFNSDEKEIILEFSEKSSYELSEIFMFIVDFLEEHSHINYKKGENFKTVDIYSEDLISLLEVLLDARINPDRIIEVLQNASNIEISNLLSLKRQKQSTYFRKLEKL